MYAWVRQVGIKRFGVSHLPSLVVSLFIAELFYKFHSFILECVAFLATWTVLSWVHSKFEDRRKSAGQVRGEQRPSS
jgi:hypothetical protein